MKKGFLSHYYRGGDTLMFDEFHEEFDKESLKNIYFEPDYEDVYDDEIDEDYITL